MEQPKYLLRRDDFSVFRLGPDGLYRLNNRKDTEQQYNWFRLEKLINIYGFIPIREQDVTRFEELHKAFLRETAAEPKVVVDDQLPSTIIIDDAWNNQDIDT